MIAEHRPTQEGRRTVAVIGAGPVGVDAALAALDRGFAVRLYEAASRPAGNVRDWGHVRLFTPWGMNLSPRMRARLEAEGLLSDVDDDASPTGHDFVDRALDPLVRVALGDAVRLGTRVLAVGREGVLKHEEIGAPTRERRPFRLLLRDATGREWVERASAVLDCTGKYGNPNTLGDGGIPAPGEASLGERRTTRIPDLRGEPETWAGRTILLAGSGHSAQTAARDLAELPADRAPRVIWTVRPAEPDWGAVADDPLPDRRALVEAARSLASGAAPGVELRPRTVVDRVEPRNGSVRVTLKDIEGGPEDELAVDHVLALTGGVGDHTLYRQLQVHECYATSGPMKLAAALLGAGGGGDCLDQRSQGADTLQNPEPGFYILGDKSYGRNNTFLLRVGWQQVDEVFSTLEEV